MDLRGACRCASTSEVEAKEVEEWSDREWGSVRLVREPRGACVSEKTRSNALANGPVRPATAEEEEEYHCQSLIHGCLSPAQVSSSLHSFTPGPDLLGHSVARLSKVRDSL